eukprot:scaffold2544_cov141-Isochrysis_galbana.AAC.4
MARRAVAGQGIRRHLPFIPAGLPGRLRAPPDALRRSSPRGRRGFTARAPGGTGAGRQPALRPRNARPPLAQPARGARGRLQPGLARSVPTLAAPTAHRRRHGALHPAPVPTVRASRLVCPIHRPAAPDTHPAKVVPPLHVAGRLWHPAKLMIG